MYVWFIHNKSNFLVGTTHAKVYGGGKLRIFFIGLREGQRLHVQVVNIVGGRKKKKIQP